MGSALFNQCNREVISVTGKAVAWGAALRLHILLTLPDSLSMGARSIKFLPEPHPESCRFCLLPQAIHYLGFSISSESIT